MSNIAPALEPSGKFHLNAALATARGLIKGTKRHVFLLSLVVGLAISIMTGLFGADPYTGEPASIWFHVCAAIMNGVTALIYATVGLLAAAGEKVTFKRAFSYFHRLPQVLSVTVPLTLLFGLVQTFASIWVWMALGLASAPMAFWVFYLLDRDLGQLEAITRSYTLVLNNLGSYILYMLLTVSLAILVGVTLGIAGIWLLPLILYLPGVMFAMAEGLQGDYSSQAGANSAPH